MGQEIYSVQEPIEEDTVEESPVVEEPVQEDPVVEEDPVIEEHVEENPDDDPVVEEPLEKEPDVEEPLEKEPVVEDELVEIQQEIRPRKKFTLKRVHKNRKTRRTKLKKKFMRPPTPHLM